MLTDEEMKAGLRAAGIPPTVYGTTLLKEGAPELRQVLLDHSIIPKGDAPGRGVFLYPAKPKQSVRLRKLFYLIAKELYMTTGARIQCLEMMDFMRAIDFKDEDRPSDALDAARVVFLLNFYERDCLFPFTAEQTGWVRTWIRQRLEEGKTLCFLSDSCLDECIEWWPASILSNIRPAVTEYKIQ